MYFKLIVFGIDKLWLHGTIWSNSHVLPN